MDDGKFAYPLRRSRTSPAHMSSSFRQRKLNAQPGADICLGVEVPPPSPRRASPGLHPRGSRSAARRSGTRLPKIEPSSAGFAPQASPELDARGSEPSSAGFRLSRSLKFAQTPPHRQRNVSILESPTRKRAFPLREQLRRTAALNRVNRKASSSQGFPSSPRGKTQLPPVPKLAPSPKSSSLRPPEPRRKDSFHEPSTYDSDSSSSCSSLGQLSIHSQQDNPSHLVRREQRRASLGAVSRSNENQTPQQYSDPSQVTLSSHEQPSRIKWNGQMFRSEDASSHMSEEVKQPADPSPAPARPVQTPADWSSMLSSYRHCTQKLRSSASLSGRSALTSPHPRERLKPRAKSAFSPAPPNTPQHLPSTPGNIHPGFNSQSLPSILPSSFPSPQHAPLATTSDESTPNEEFEEDDTEKLRAEVLRLQEELASVKQAQMQVSQALRPFQATTDASSPSQRHADIPSRDVQYS